MVSNILKTLISLTFASLALYGVWLVFEDGKKGIPDPPAFDPEYRETEVMVRWDGNYAGLEKRLENRKAHGFVEFRDDACVINAPEPTSTASKQELETLGHEMLHCFWGHYHGSIYDF